MMLDFNKKFKVEKLYVTSIGNWTISLRPEQPTIGSLILSLSRTCSSLSELTEQESIDLGKAFSAIEIIFHKTFKPEKINYLALMMVDDQVHFHVLPRYSEVIYFENKEFKDECWPVAHNLQSLSQIDSFVMEKIQKLFSLIY